MTLFICTLFFAAMYAVKGGQLGHIKGFNELRKSNPVYDAVLDGKVLSPLGVLIFGFLATTEQVGAGLYNVPAYELRWSFMPFLLAIGWLAAVAPSMGEEVGACGRWGRAWGPYIEKGFGRKYGVKKALQRGVFVGAMLALVTGFVPFIIAGATLPVCYFIGQEIYYRKHGRDSWAYAEWIYGGVIGLCFGFYV